jgi:hypothetical protein
MPSHSLPSHGTWNTVFRKTLVYKTDWTKETVSIFFNWHFPEVFGILFITTARQGPQNACTTVTGRLSEPWGVTSEFLLRSVQNSLCVFCLHQCLRTSRSFPSPPSLPFTSPGFAHFLIQSSRCVPSLSRCGVKSLVFRSLTCARGSQGNKCGPS